MKKRQATTEKDRMMGEDIKLQVLVSTMQQSDHRLAEKMKIQSDAIIVNQCDSNNIEEFEYENYTIKFLSLNERGIGLSRNTALMRADSDICIFADEDVVFVDNYREIIVSEFQFNKNADIILFNVPSTNPQRPTYIIPKPSRVRWYNSLRYGAVKVAVRTERIREANVYFSLIFGGGARYSSGEDSLFIFDCLRKGLKLYASPAVIGCVKQESSTWFEGYTDKYFIDRGAFYACLNKNWARLLCLQFAIRHRNLYRNEKKFLEAIKLMFAGVKLFNV